MGKPRFISARFSKAQPPAQVAAPAASSRSWNSSGVVFKEKSGAAFINMAAAPGTSSNFANPARAFENPVPYDQLNTMPWALWGTDNLLPNQMIADIETCGILNAIIDGKARMALCEGLVPVFMKYDGKQRVIDKICDDPMIIDFLENNNQFLQTFGWMKDLCGFGMAAGRIMLNKEGTAIVNWRRDDVTEWRLEKEKDGKINSVYISAQWDKNITQVKDKRLVNIPLLDMNNPLQDLRDKAAAGMREIAFIFRQPAWGKHYYNVPLWYAAYKWVKIAQGVPEMKAAMFENNIRLKYMVVIYDKYWETTFENWESMTDDEKTTARNTLYDEIDKWLTGSKNAYKSIFVEGNISLDGKLTQYIDIKPIPDTTQAGELLPDSAAANSEIAFAMMWNNALTGGNQKNGLYQENQGGSNVREASALQVIVSEFERQVIRNLFNVFKKFNGWDKEFPGLEFIIPGTILTTLDTGGSTKPVMTGQPSSNNSQNGIDQNNRGS